MILKLRRKMMLMGQLIVVHSTNLGFIKDWQKNYVGDRSKM